ncbi:dTDP-4-dehydrorhamnose 3,5-epimerase family protein [Pseudogemmobacter sp. W21_MBD1_M6]|jgi:dTDP-4-dehydrorhamnose 3,5-epimerase|uniref:dTDP-4-dehydrorhamnose 3,5-epimerase family protein n=1 Tax=Pseudogemmobacter sp. W21_MBD1_M6 TaxID=3240271 RepID=UPI003F944F62
MKFTPLSLPGIILVTLEPNGDARGSFARLYCQEKWAEQGLCTNWVQMNQSCSAKRGTARGLHFQREPQSEIKMVRCTRGSVIDYFVDLRQGAATYGQWGSIELNADVPSLIYIPEGFAHGFQTLADDTSLLYWHSRPYSPDHQGGVRFDDVGIDLPLPVSVISERDLSFAPMAEQEPLTP